ncbi:hypothetical protein BJV74DRAFT_948798 [Russula compacta]|nr:hypothetical protein BJV74DRAFT_948798 [Russula compacta]
MKNQHKLALPSASDITDVAEMEEAIEYCGLLLASSRSDRELAAYAHMALASLLQNASSLTDKIEYLDEAITLLRGEIDIPCLRPVQFPVIGTLITCLSIRFNLLHLGGVLNEIMQLSLVAVNDKCAPTPDRFLLSCDWASISDFVTKRDTYEKLPLDYASHQIHTDQLERPSNEEEPYSGQRCAASVHPLKNLRVADSHLADKFVAVNRDLEMLTLTVLPGSNNGGEDGGSERMDPFGHLIQAKPDFETFLDAPSSDNLRSAAVRGPVIMINHCEWRSDILILLHNSPPSLIPTTNDFYGHANHLRDQLLGARRKGLESNEYEETLCSAYRNNLEFGWVRHLLFALFHPPRWVLSHQMGGPKQYFLGPLHPLKPEKPSILLVAQPDASIAEGLEEMQVVQAAKTQVTRLIFSKGDTHPPCWSGFGTIGLPISCAVGTLEPGQPFEASFELYDDERVSRNEEGPMHPTAAHGNSAGFRSVVFGGTYGWAIWQIQIQIRTVGQNLGQELTFTGTVFSSDSDG